LEHWQAISVDEQLTKEAAEKRQDVYFGQQVYQKETTHLTPHGGISDSCAAQGLSVIHLGGNVIVPEDVADEDVKVELELQTGWLDEEELEVEFEL
jgi:hypothetical protein